MEKNHLFYIDLISSTYFEFPPIKCKGYSMSYNYLVDYNMTKNRFLVKVTFNLKYYFIDLLIYKVHRI